MNKILIFTTLTLTLCSNFAAAGNVHPRQQKYLVCSKSMGAMADFSAKIDHCANISLDDGCYCGPKHQVHAMLEKIHDRRSDRVVK